MDSDLIDALINMFNEFSHSEQTECLITSSDSIKEILSESGFNSKQINLAISWLEAFSIGNTDQKVIKQKSPNSFRVLSSEEKRQLSPDAISYLNKKLKNDVLTNKELELILDQISMIDKDEVDVDKISWIYHMTRLNFQENEKYSNSNTSDEDPFSYLPTHITNNYLHYIH